MESVCTHNMVPQTKVGISGLSTALRNVGITARWGPHHRDPHEAGRSNRTTCTIHSRESICMWSYPMHVYVRWLCWRCDWGEGKELSCSSICCAKMFNHPCWCWSADPTLECITWYFPSPSVQHVLRENWGCQEEVAHKGDHRCSRFVWRSQSKTGHEVRFVEATTFTMENVLDHLEYAESMNLALLKEAAMKFIV